MSYEDDEDLKKGFVGPIEVKPDVEAAIDWLCEGDNATKMFTYLANGGSLIEFCELAQIRFSDFQAAGIHNDEFQKLLQKAHEVQVEWQRHRINLELRRISTVDIRKLFNDNGTLKPVKEWDADTARSVESIKVVEMFNKQGEHIGDVKNIKFAPKLKALEMFGKEIGMFVEKYKHEVSTSFEDLITESRKPRKDETKVD